MSHAVHHHCPELKRLLPCAPQQIRGLSALTCRSSGDRDEAKLLLLAQDLRDEIQLLIRQVVAEGRGKEELCLLLGCLLKRYCMLKSRAYRFAINNFIVGETETYCSFRMDTEELILLWAMPV